MSWSKLYIDILRNASAKWLTVKGKKTEKEEFLREIVAQIEAQHNEKYAEEPINSDLLKVCLSYVKLYN